MVWSYFLYLSLQFQEKRAAGNFSPRLDVQPRSPLVQPTAIVDCIWPLYNRNEQTNNCKTPQNIPFCQIQIFKMRCGAVRCDAMRGHAMQGNAITTSVWAMYRNQYRILYALPGKHDTRNEIDFCDRSFHLSNAQSDAASNWNCFGLGSWVALLLMQS